MRRNLFAILAAACIGGLGVNPRPAVAGPQCFSTFGGTVTVLFNSKVTSTKPLSGRIFGALASCAGLDAWPVLGSAVRNAAKTQVTLAFRAMTVDNAICGAADFIAALSLPTLSGPLQLHNDRSGFSNTDTLTLVPCPTSPPPAASVRPATGVDVLGNSNQ